MHWRWSLPPLPGPTSLWMSRLVLQRVCCSSLPPEEGTLIWLYTCLKAGSDCLLAKTMRSSTGRSTTMESGTRSVDSCHTTHTNQTLIMDFWMHNEVNHMSFFMRMVKMFPVGHVQFGEEEIPIGCRWDQSPGRSADTCWVCIHEAIHIACVLGQRPGIPVQRVKGKENTQACTYFILNSVFLF